MPKTIPEMREWLRTHDHPDVYKLSDTEVRTLYDIFNDQTGGIIRMPEHDAVNHPKHYTDGKYECIDFIESCGLGFHLGNAVKYITRAGKKDPEKKQEDIKKAKWYVKRARTCTNHLLRCPPHGFDEKNEEISIYDYASDKQLSYPLAQALLSIVRGDLDAALVHLDAELAQNASFIHLEGEIVQN